MEELSYPDRLSNLAMEALVQNIARTIEFVGSKKPAELEKVCTYLEEFVCQVAPALANNLTAKLLHVVGEPMKLAAVVMAIVHPATTHLTDVQDKLHPSVVDYFYWLPCNVVEALHRLPRLRVLRYCHSYHTHENSVPQFPASLEELDYRDCTDAIVQQLVLSCPLLRILSVCYSYVTDTAIPAILQLRELVELGVSYTRITEDGITKLLLGLSRLQSFSCSSVNTSHLLILTHRFPDLQALSLVVDDDCDLLPLQSLQSLRRLSLQHSVFNAVHGLLDGALFSLECLELYDVANVDLSVIAELCPSVKCLHLLSWDVQDEEDDLTELPSVHCLQLAVPDENLAERIVASCVNLRKVYILKYSSPTLVDCIVALPHIQQLMFNVKRCGGVVVQLKEKHAVVMAIDFKQHRKTMLSLSYPLNDVYNLIVSKARLIVEKDESHRPVD